MYAFASVGEAGMDVGCQPAGRYSLMAMGIRPDGRLSAKKLALMNPNLDLHQSDTDRFRSVSYTHLTLPTNA